MDRTAASLWIAIDRAGPHCDDDRPSPCILSCWDCIWEPPGASVPLSLVATLNVCYVGLLAICQSSTCRTSFCPSARLLGSQSMPILLGSSLGTYAGVGYHVVGAEWLCWHRWPLRAHCLWLLRCRSRCGWSRWQNSLCWRRWATYVRWMLQECWLEQPCWRNRALRACHTGWPECRSCHTWSRCQDSHSWCCGTTSV